jgi:hypothetical protein
MIAFLIRFFFMIVLNIVGFSIIVTSLRAKSDSEVMLGLFEFLILFVINLVFIKIYVLNSKS